LQENAAMPVNTPPFARLPQVFDNEAILRELQFFDRLEWTPHVNQANYSGGWDVVPLRCLDQHAEAHPILQSFAIEAGDDWCNLPLLERSPALKQLIDGLHCDIKAVRLMRLKAGAEIKPHRDRGLGLEFGEARLHLPLVTDDKVAFMVAGQRVPMQAGELWYIDADKTHSVSNNGDLDRVNLVIDCRAHAWLREQIDAA